MQSRKMLRMGLALTLASVAVIAGCDRGNVSSPELTAPRAPVATPGISMMRAAQPGQQKVAVQMIGAQGGTIELDGRRLIVPAGAVSTPTLFKVTISSDQFVRVELKATRRNHKGNDDDVGGQGFARPIRLEFSYTLASGVTDPSKLGIAWVREDGTMVRLPSVVNTGKKTVSSDLEHFSGYALVSD